MTTQARSQTRPKQRGVPLPGLREWRFYRTYSQAQLAELAGISQITVCQIETGVNWAGWQTIQKLAGALGISVEQLRYEDPPQRQTMRSHANVA